MLEKHVPCPANFGTQLDCYAIIDTLTGSQVWKLSLTGVGCPAVPAAAAAEAVVTRTRRRGDLVARCFLKSFSEIAFLRAMQDCTPVRTSADHKHWEYSAMVKVPTG